MTADETARTGGPGEDEAVGRGPVIRDKRRIDPETGEARRAPAAEPDRGDVGGVSDDAPAEPGGAARTGAPAQPGAAEPGTAEPDPVVDGAVPADGPHPDTLLAAQRLEEMRRMQAEFVNFRNRTQRDREGDRARATGAVVESLLPVLDDIHWAREHGDLVEGTPLAAISEKIEQALGRFGVERVGEVGEVFDPTVHEALMHMPADSPDVEMPEGATEMTVVQVMQPGFRIGEQVVRAARVAVADPA